MEDIDGITLPMSLFFNENFDPDTYSDNNSMIANFAPMAGYLELADYDSSSHNYTPVNEPKPLEAIKEADLVDKCSLAFPIVFLMLFTIGAVSNVGSFVSTALNYRRIDYYHVYFHVCVCNIVLLLPIPFLVIARFQEYWMFGDLCAKILSFIAAMSHTVCGFQLTYLSIAGCKDIVRKIDHKRTKTWEVVLSFSFWLMAALVSWPAVKFPDALQDMIEGKEQQKFSTEASTYVTINTFITFGLPCTLVLMSIMIIFAFEKHRADKRECEKNPDETENNIKEVLILSAMYFILWSPLHIYRMMFTMDSTNPSPNCHMPMDIFLTCGLLFSTLMPIVHRFVCHKRSHTIQMRNSTKDSSTSSSSFFHEHEARALVLAHV